MMGAGEVVGEQRGLEDDSFAAQTVWKLMCFVANSLHLRLENSLGFGKREGVELVPEARRPLSFLREVRSRAENRSLKISVRVSHSALYTESEVAGAPVVAV
jgi:hypothetical protein